MPPFSSLFNLASPAQPYIAIIELTAAQIALAGSAPAELLPAPGAGRTIVPLLVAGQATDGSIPFYASGVEIAYTGDAQNLIDNNVPLAGGLAPPDPFWFQIVRIPAGTFPRPTIENTAISLFGGGDDSSGAILANVLNAGGLGYAPADTFTISGGLVLATGVVDTVGGGGAVLTYHLTAHGAGYVPAAGVATTATSGGGAGLTININTVTPANGTARIWILYLVLDLA